MNKINEASVPTQTVQSPKGAFSIQRKHLSLALGGVKDKGVWAGGHPFDVELSSIPAGKKNWPLHAHAAQTEYYIVLSGTGRVLNAEGSSLEIGAGDHFICLPGEAHQISNNSDAELVYYVISDHQIADITTYPKTGKRMLKPGDDCVFTEAADYYEGEE